MYSITKDEDVFNEIYDILSSEWSRGYRYHARKLWSSPEEVQAAFEDTLLSVLTKYDGQRPFANLLARSIKNTKATIYRKCKRYCESQPLIVDHKTEDSEELPIEIADEYTLEQQFFESQTKGDQRQLISHLIDPDKVSDAKTTAIVEAFPKYNSITALGKALGMHHEQVLRRLRKLAKNYDPNEFGDIHDYLSA